MTTQKNPQFHHKDKTTNELRNLEKINAFSKHMMKECNR